MLLTSSLLNSMEGVVHGFTTRHGGVSAPPFDSLNLDELEKWAIQAAIKKHQGNVSNAAQELGLSRGAMYRRMEKYEL